MATRYRISQFIRGLTARLTQEEREWVRRQLSPPACALFESMPAQDQRHGMDVARLLEQHRTAEPALVAAGLLHDVGKAGSGLSLFHRSAIVLLDAIQQNWRAKLLSTPNASPGGWRKPFWIHLQHPDIGAELARSVGCDELTIWLIQHHHHEPAELEGDERQLAMLVSLQEADGHS